MIPFRKSLAFRVLFLSFILLSLPILVDAFILLHERYQLAIANAKKYLVELGKTRELPIAELFPSKTPILILLENALNLEESFPKKSSDELNSKLKSLVEKGGFSDIELLEITDDNKYVIIGSSAGMKQIGRDDTTFIKTLGLSVDKIEANSIYIEKERQNYFVNGRIILGPEGKPVGVFVVYTDVAESLNALLLPDVDKYPVYFAILISDTLVYASTDLGLVFQYFTPLSDEKKKDINY